MHIGHTSVLAAVEGHVTEDAENTDPVSPSEDDHEDVHQSSGSSGEAIFTMTSNTSEGSLQSQDTNDNPQLQAPRTKRMTSFDSLGSQNSLLSSFSNPTSEADLSPEELQMRKSSAACAQPEAFVSKTVLDAMDSIALQKAAVGDQHGRIIELTRGRFFNVFMSSVIAVHAVYLGVETDFADQGKSEGAWFYIELGFTLIYCVELLLKLCAESVRFFYDRWNVFDCFLVMMSCLDTFLLEHITQDDGHTRHVDVMSVLRILRLLRITRIIRLLRFFKTLWLLITGVLDAMGTLVWAWVLITIIIFVFAVFMTRVLGIPHASSNQEVREQFGRVENSMFTFFQVMTLEGWPSIARSAMKFEPWIWVVFIVFLLTTTFSIMNVIVAVIVEGTLSSAQDRQSETTKKTQAEEEKTASRIAEIFSATDQNGDNEITRDEFLSSIKSEEVMRFLTEVGIDMRQAENLFDILDYDDSGSLDVEEFSKGILKARGEAQARDVLAVQCELWKYELKVKEALRNVCKRVHADMSKVDIELELLHLDISKLDACIHAGAAIDALQLESTVAYDDGGARFAVQMDSPRLGRHRPGNSEPFRNNNVDPAPVREALASHRPGIHPAVEVTEL